MCACGKQRWFDQDNSSFGLMCQAALLMAHHIIDIAHDTDSICGGAARVIMR
ncbi:hypothetical protein [Moraxella ovis]|uniref:hypothetical protein n=1 Tax=Moraxella ovis TaxID=29433 RepID=UPI00283A97E9|nr:hypothetical protein [Moraxella ovis]